MKVFIAGATGAVGRPLVRALISDGHDVVAMTRSPARGESVRALGAELAIADALDRPAVTRAVEGARPEVVINQLTSLDAVKNFKRFDAEFEATNRLRTEGNDSLIAAARAAGASRFIAQSYGGWTYEPNGDELKVEQDAFDPSPPRNQRQSLIAIRHLEDAVLSADGLTGVSLRYANFYGPGTSIAENGAIARQVRRRMLPIVGDGAGVWSFIHIADAVAATVAALERGSGVINVVDDEPAPVHAWLPELARALGAKPPRRVPKWVGRLAAGDVGVSMMTRIRGMSNAKARGELGWQPRYASYRTGFADGLADPSAA